MPRPSEFIWTIRTLFKKAELGPQLEPYTIPLSIPLVNLSARTGTTAMLPGTHKVLVDDPLTKDVRRSQLPFAQMGDCYFMDFPASPLRNRKPFRRGMRPIIYVVYSRPWFIDASNFDKQPPIDLSAAELVKIPHRYAGLFKRVRETTRAARLS